MLGVDIGSRRVGVALSDPTGTIAQSHRVIVRHSWKHVITAVAALAREYRVERVVVGLPLRLDGREGEAAAEARKFAERLTAALEVPVVLEDERLTTAEAERTMVEADAGRLQRRERRDAVAAALILQRHLDRRRPAPRSDGEETTGGDTP